MIAISHDMYVRVKRTSWVIHAINVIQDFMAMDVSPVLETLTIIRYVAKVVYVMMVEKVLESACALILTMTLMLSVNFIMMMIMGMLTSMLLDLQFCC